MLHITSTKQTLEQGGVKILVHGPPGAGKTRLCATTGDLEHTLIISAEGGLLSIKSWEIDMVEVHSIRDVYEVYEFLKKGDHPYRWVCVDSISELAEVILQGEKLRNRDGRRAYGEMADTVFDLLRGFRNLPCHVMMTAKQAREEHEGQLLFVPMLPGRQLTQNIAYLFDEVFALRVEPGPQGQVVRVLQTGRNKSYEAKDRSGRLQMYEEADLSLIWAKIAAAGAKNEDEEGGEQEVIQKSPDGKRMRIASSSTPHGVRVSGQDAPRPGGAASESGDAGREALRRRLFHLLKPVAPDPGEMRRYVQARCEREHGCDGVDELPLEVLEHWAKELERLECTGGQGARRRHLEGVIARWERWTHAKHQVA